MGSELQKHINANINFVQVVSSEPDHTELYLQTYERGCGLTLACGTGASSVYSVGLAMGIIKEMMATVRTEGGVLKVCAEEGKITLSGAVEFMCTGEYYEKEELK
jgi:diaminopimelate epimerase